MSQVLAVPLTGAHMATIYINFVLNLLFQALDCIDHCVVPFFFVCRPVL